MTFTYALFVLLMSAVVGSYTWAMRGTIIGGERGAMLPGAALATVLICAGGVAPVAEAFPFAAAIGAAGMFFGGSEPYGETISLTFSADAQKRFHGRLGLAVKGAGWFGVFAGILGVGLGAMAGRYAAWELVLFTALLPVVKWLGILLIWLLKKRVPALYFSEKRFEVWGGLALLCVYIMLFAAVCGEWFPVLLCVFGLLSGGLGFFVGNLFQTKFADKGNGYIDSWKWMECTLGAVGGLGVALCWCLFYNRFVRKYALQIVGHSGVWSAFRDKTDAVLLYVWLFLFMLFILRYVFDPKKQSTSKFIDFVYRAEDIFIYPVFCYVPLLLSMCGVARVAELQSFFILLFVIGDKILFGGEYHDEKIFGKKVYHCVLVLVPAAVLCIQLFTDITFSARCTLLTVLFAYLLAEYYVVFNPTRLHTLCKETGSLPKAILAVKPEITWMAFGGVCCIVTALMSIFYF